MSFVEKTRILVIDDDASILNQASRVFSALNVKNYATADTYKTAREKIDKVCWDLIILDVRMPRNAGIQVYNYIRKHPEAKISNTPMIMITAGNDKTESAFVSENEDDETLNKPFTDMGFKDALMSRLNSCILSVNMTSDESDNAGMLMTATEAMLSGDLKNARLAVQRKIEKDPSSPRLNTLLGRIYFADSDSKASLTVANKILSSNRNYLPALNLKSKSLVKLNNFEEALKTMEYAQSISPLNVQRSVSIGVLHLACGRPGAAEDRFKKALVVEPDNEDARTGLVKCLFEQGKAGEAEGELSKLADPWRALSDINLRGVMLSRSGQPKKALEYYEQALKFTEHPDLKAKIYYNMTIAAIRNNNIELAKDTSQKAAMAVKETQSADLVKKIEALHAKVKNFKQGADIINKDSVTTRMLTMAELSVVMGCHTMDRKNMEKIPHVVKKNLIEESEEVVKELEEVVDLPGTMSDGTTLEEVEVIEEIYNENTSLAS